MAERSPSDGDRRIASFRRYVRALATGQYRVPAPSAGDDNDDVARLGRDLFRLARTLERRFEEFKALAQVTEQINAGLLVTEVLEHVYDNFHRFIPYNRIGFALIETAPDGRVLVRSHWARSDSPHMQIRADYVAPLAGSSMQPIMETGEPRILNDLEQYLAEHPQSSSTRLIVEEGIRSSLTCPLIVMGKPIGFLFFSSAYTNTYRDAHVEIFQEIAGQLSIIVEKSRLYQDLLELNQTRSRFLGMAAHDLRSPLVSIQRSLAVLTGKLGEAPDPAEGAELLARMEHSCQRMVVLIEDLLDISSIDSGTLRLKRRAVDLSAFLGQICRQFEHQARGKSITLRCEAAIAGPVWVDPERMEQVLDNLVSNAIKFSYPEGVIELRAEHREADVLISVSDRGQGIAADELPKLFKAFSRTSATPTAGEPSTGLGLLISKRLVEAHGGSIWAESREGEGTTVRLTLPTRSHA